MKYALWGEHHVTHFHRRIRQQWSWWLWLLPLIGIAVASGRSERCRGTRSISRNGVNVVRKPLHEVLIVEGLRIPFPVNNRLCGRTQMQNESIRGAKRNMALCGRRGERGRKRGRRTPRSTPKTRDSRSAPQLKHGVEFRFERICLNIPSAQIGRPTCRVYLLQLFAMQLDRKSPRYDTLDLFSIG